MAGHVEQSSQLAQTLRARLSQEELSVITQLAGTSGAAGTAAPDETEAREKRYQEILSSMLPTLLDRRSWLSRQKDLAPQLLEELLEQPVERRRVLVRNSPRFLSRPLCELLQDRSQDACFRRPPEAVALAQLAVDIADRLSGEAPGAAAVCDLRARSLGFLANAYRVTSEPQLSEETLDAAELVLEEGGSGDLLETAWLKSLRANLKGVQGRLDESLSLFDQAMRIYRRCGEDHLVGRTMISKAMYFGYAGDPEQAIRLLRRGLPLIDTQREPRLALAANHNLIYYLTDLGHHEEAAELLDSSRPLYFELGDRTNLMRLRWLEGRMARELDKPQEAERAFLETREAFLQEEMAWDVALVSLELAAVYLQQGRTAEIKTLADELLPIFQATGLHREALASLILFQKAAELEKVTTDLIRKTMSRLHSLRRDR